MDTLWKLNIHCSPCVSKNEMGRWRGQIICINSSCQMTSQLREEEGCHASVCPLLYTHAHICQSSTSSRQKMCRRRQTESGRQKFAENTNSKWQINATFSPKGVSLLVIAFLCKFTQNFFWSEPFFSSRPLSYRIHDGPFGNKDIWIFDMLSLQHSPNAIETQNCWFTEPVSSKEYCQENTTEKVFKMSFCELKIGILPGNEGKVVLSSAFYILLLLIAWRKSCSFSIYFFSSIVCDRSQSFHYFNLLTLIQMNILNIWAVQSGWPA